MRRSSSRRGRSSSSSSCSSAAAARRGTTSRSINHRNNEEEKKIEKNECHHSSFRFFYLFSNFSSSHLYFLSHSDAPRRLRAPGCTSIFASSCSHKRRIESSSSSPSPSFSKDPDRRCEKKLRRCRCCCSIVAACRPACPRGLVRRDRGHLEHLRDLRTRWYDIVLEILRLSLVELNDEERKKIERHLISSRSTTTATSTW